jgi:hypothetical protein
MVVREAFAKFRVMKSQCAVFILKQAGKINLQFPDRADETRI